MPLVLERGVCVELGFRLGPAKRHVLEVTVLDDAGLTVVKAQPEVARVSETTPTTAWLGLGLAPGRYVLQLRHNGGEARVAVLEVPKEAGTSLRQVSKSPDAPRAPQLLSAQPITPRLAAPSRHG